MKIKTETKVQKEWKSLPIIRPGDISDTDFELGCRVLFASISLALEDPIARAQYAAWKKRRKQHET